MTSDPVHEERKASSFWILVVGLLLLGLMNLVINPDFPSHARAQTDPDPTECPVDPPNEG